MNEQLDYRLGLAVVSSDDKHVGSLEALIADGDNFQPRALVVKETKWFSGHVLSPGSALLTDEVAIPVDSVASLTRDRIDIMLTGAQVRRLPPYLTYHYQALTPREVEIQQLVHLTGEPALPSLVETAAKGPDEVEISPGEHVMLPGGHKLGTVKDLLYDGDVLIGVVLLPDGLFKQEVILPRRFLKHSDDLALFAALTAEDLQTLQPFKLEEH
jgi:hypothetical protein